MPVTFRRRRSLAATGLALSLAAAVTGCAREDNSGTSEEHPEVSLVEAGQLTVCTSLPYPPFEFEQSGEVVGFDIALLDLVAEELGVDLEIIDTPFEGIQSGQDLNNERCDVAAAAMTITEEREAVLDFSDGYFDANQAMLVPADSPYTSLADVAGQRVGVQAGTTGEMYVTEQNEAQGLDLDIVTYEDPATQQQALANGDIAAAVNDLPVWADFVDDNPDFIIGAEFDTGEEYGFAVRTGNSALLDVINDVLQQAREDGTYDEIYEEWIGQAPSASSPSPSAS